MSLSKDALNVLCSIPLNVIEMGGIKEGSVETQRNEPEDIHFICIQKAVLKPVNVVFWFYANFYAPNKG